MKINKSLKVANKLRNFALKYFSKHFHPYWSGLGRNNSNEYFDREMMDCGYEDYINILELAQLIEEEKFKKAYNKLYYFDTILRDSIPDYVFTFVDKKCEQIIKINLCSQPKK